MQPPPSLQRLFQDLSVLVGIIHGISLIAMRKLGKSGVGWRRHCAVRASLPSSWPRSRRRAGCPSRERSSTNHAPIASRTGPFRFVRHPLDPAYSLAWLAVPVAMNSEPPGLTAAGLIACYAASAVEEERRLLASPLGAEYREGMKSTRRLVPFVY